MLSSFFIIIFTQNILGLLPSKIETIKTWCERITFAKLMKLVEYLHYKYENIELSIIYSLVFHLRALFMILHWNKLFAETDFLKPEWIIYWHRYRTFWEGYQAFFHKPLHSKLRMPNFPICLWILNKYYLLNPYTKIYQRINGKKIQCYPLFLYLDTTWIKNCYSSWIRHE